MFIILSIIACVEPVQDGASTPIDPSPRSQAVVNLRAPTRPDGDTPLTVSDRTKSELSHILIELEELEEDSLARALELLNTTTGPCEPCMTQGISTADCVLADEPIACRNISDYASFVVSVASNNENMDSARQQVTFVEPWQSGAVSATATTGAVQFSVGLDLVDPFTPAVLDVVSQLQAEFSDQIDLTYKYTPLERHPESRNAVRYALAGVDVERVVTAYTGGETEEQSLMQVEGVEARYSTPEVEAGLADAVQAMSVLGVDASPTFWIDGYRCSGAQRIEALRTMIERAQAIRALQ